MPPRRSARRALLTLSAATAAVLASACAADGGDASRLGPDGVLTAGGRDLGGEQVMVAAAATSNEMPDIVVDDVGRFKKVNLKNIFPSDVPVLLWLWAPSCPICASEADGVERFAREHAAEVEVIGLGTQDTLQMGVDFIERHRLESFTMLWDKTGLSWGMVGISSQPSAVLLRPDGTIVRRWVGAIPEAEVLDLASQFPA